MAEALQKNNAKCKGKLLKFSVDGECPADNETPDDYDLENEDCVDVILK